MEKKHTYRYCNIKGSCGVQKKGEKYEDWETAAVEQKTKRRFAGKQKNKNVKREGKEMKDLLQYIKEKRPDVTGLAEGLIRQAVKAICEIETDEDGMRGGIKLLLQEPLGMTDEELLHFVYADESDPDRRRILWSDTAADERLFDVILLRDHVYIGMEDVSVTYITAGKMTSVPAEEVLRILEKGCQDWNNDPVVVSERKQREQGKSSYYPNEHSAPCMAVIFDHGCGLDNRCLVNSSDIWRAVRNGAERVYFCDGIDLEKTKRFLS